MSLKWESGIYAKFVDRCIRARLKVAAATPDTRVAT